MTLLSFWTPPQDEAQLVSNYMPPGWSYHLAQFGGYSIGASRFPGQLNGTLRGGYVSSGAAFVEPYDRGASPTTTTVTAGVAVRPLSRNPSHIMSIGTQGQEGSDLRIESTGTLTVGGVSVPMNPLALNAWHYIEWAYKPPYWSGGDGSVVNVLRVNGEEFSFNHWTWTGSNGSRTPVNAARFWTHGSSVGSGAVPYTEICDMYVCRGPGPEFLGDVTIDRLNLIGDGSTSQFIGSDGDSVDNYLNVNRFSVDLDFYNEADTDGQTDSYLLGGYAPHGASELVAVMPTGMAAKTGDQVRKLTPSITQGGFTQSGQPTYLGNGEPGILRAYPMTTSPSGEPWTVADLAESELVWTLNDE